MKPNKNYFKSAIYSFRKRIWLVATPVVVILILLVTVFIFFSFNPNIKPSKSKTNSDNNLVHPQKENIILTPIGEKMKKAEEELLSYFTNKYGPNIDNPRLDILDEVEDHTSGGEAFKKYYNQ